jgi:hypothetical protein
VDLRIFPWQPDVVEVHDDAGVQARKDLQDEEIHVPTDPNGMPGIDE